MALCEHGYTLNWDCPICETGERMPPELNPLPAGEDAPRGKLLAPQDEAQPLVDERTIYSWLAATSKAAQSVLDEYGPCVECEVETCNTDDGDFICEGCLEDARAQQRSDDRHNDPRRGQARGFR